MDHRWAARGLVLGLHLALLAALWMHQPASLKGPDGQRMSVRIVLPPKPSTPPPPPPDVRQPPPRAVLPAAPVIAPPSFTTEAAPAQPAAATAPQPDTHPAEPPRTTLRLTLPPGYAASSAAARNPALSDARSNTARRTLEDRIADAAAATGEWVSERTSDHRTVLRRGDTCMEVLRSRIADMDPFNGNVAPRTVPMMGKPYKCK